MKKFTIVLTVLIAMTIKTNAQWVTLNSTTTDTLNSVFFIDADNGFVLGANFNSTPIVNLLLETTDGGINWTSKYPAPLSIFFTDLNNGYWSGLDTIYKTTDAGVSVTKCPLGLGSSAFVSNIYFYNSSVGYAAVYDYITQAMYMVHTTNAGIFWSATNGGVMSTPSEKNIFCTSANTCYVVGMTPSANRGINKTTDGGATWSNIYNPPDFDCHSVYFTSASNGVVVGSNLGIVHTTDGGNTWTQVSYDGSGSRLTGVGFTDANNGVAVGYGGTILRTEDGGATWSPMTSPTTNDLHSLHFPTATTGYAVGKTGTIIKFTGSLSGIDENKYSTTINMYPNPASDIVTLNIDNIDNQGSTVNIYNIMGSLVKTEILKQNQQQINVSEMSNGIYMIEIKSNEFFGKQKLIIQR